MAIEPCPPCSRFAPDRSSRRKRPRHCPALPGGARSALAEQSYRRLVLRRGGAAQLPKKQSPPPALPAMPRCVRFPPRPSAFCLDSDGGWQQSQFGPAHLGIEPVEFFCTFQMLERPPISPALLGRFHQIEHWSGVS